MNSTFKIRVLKNHIMTVLSCVATLVVLVPLFLVLGLLIMKGSGSLSWTFFTNLPHPVGESGGGIGNALVGTFILIGIACVIGLPFGFLGGVYLAEYGRGGILAKVLREMTDLLNGTPSIVIGIFVYGCVVIPMGHFSAFAGGIALGLMMIPTVVRTTEEMLKLVPQSLREAGLALGLPYWRVLISIVFSTAKNGILTGVLLAIARISGETAPLLFTALGNQFWNSDLHQPIAALPLAIFNYAISPYEEWQAQAWAGALTLIFLVFLLNIGARSFVRRSTKFSASTV